MNFRFTAAACTLVVGSLISATVLAQAYPNKPVKFVVGSSPGSVPDVVARTISQKMAEAWGAQIVIDNRVGASGTLASDTVAKSQPNGYTFLFADSSSWGINPHLFKKLPYDPERDLTPVLSLGTLPMFLMAKATLPAKTTQELIAYGRKQGEKLSFGSAGNGSIHHISGESFKSAAKLSSFHVPYRGVGPLAVALMAGEVDIAFLGYASVQSALDSGKVKLIAIGTEKRAASFPELPTVAESGLPGFAMYATVGILAPAGTPADIIAKVNAAAAVAVSSPEVKKKLEGLGVTVAPSSTAQFDATIKAEGKKFDKLVKLSGAQVD